VIDENIISMNLKLKFNT